MVSYAEPQSSFWGSAATFTGGAVMGGLLGYAIGDDWFDDDDDIDWDDIDIDEDDLDDLRGNRGGINIEDSTIVTGGDRIDNSKVQTELRARREGTRTTTTRVSSERQRDRVAGSGTGQSISATPGSLLSRRRWGSGTRWSLEVGGAGAPSVS